VMAHSRECRRPLIDKTVHPLALELLLLSSELL
jgi:hypothetical protein